MDWGTGTASRHSNGHRHAHTRTHTRVSAHMGSRVGPGWWHRLGHGPSGEGHGAGGAGVPVHPQGVGVMGQVPVAGAKAVNVIRGRMA